MEVKMNNQYGTLLELPLTKLNQIGILTAKSTFTKSLLSMGFLFGMTFSFVMSFMQYFYMDWSILGFVEQSESFCSISQTTFKLFICVGLKHKFLSLCKYSEQFWDADGCSEQTKKEINSFSNKIILLQKGFFYSCVVCIITLMSSAFYGKKLPIGTWSMKRGSILHKCDLIVTNINFLYYGFFIPNFDTLYVGFCCELGNQFQILHEHMQNLNADTLNNQSDSVELGEKLKNCIKQHCFLIRYFNTLKDAFSAVMMVQCFTVVPLICSEVVALSQNISFHLMMRYVTSIICVAAQIALYCIPAEYVTIQAAMIYNGIYNSIWYSKYHRSFRRAMPLMIQISQQQLEFSAMGVFTIRASTLVTIFKISMSTRTLVNDLNAK